jgi:hypothetical protein
VPSPRRPLLEQPAAWAVLLVVYVALGLVLKSAVLNWIVGPLFPLLFLYVLPRLLGRGGDARP